MIARRFVAIIALALLGIGLGVRPAQARTHWIDHGGTYLGNVVVQSGQVVEGDVNVIGGNATIAGTVDGDVNVVGGNVIERPGAVITGQINTIGGDVIRNVAPWFPQAAPTEVTRSNGPVLWNLAWAVVILLTFLIFPVRTRIALDRIERHPALCAGAGLIGFVAVIPLALFLAVTLFLIPLIAVEAVALVVGLFLGTAALSLLVGRRLYEMLSPQKTPTPLGALVLGLALLTAAQMVPLVGHLVTALIWLVGLGAAILAFIGEERFAGIPVAAAPTGASISGPPMPSA